MELFGLRGDLRMVIVNMDSADEGSSVCEIRLPAYYLRFRKKQKFNCDNSDNNNTKDECRICGFFLRLESSEILF